MARQQLADFIRKVDFLGAKISEDYDEGDPIRKIDEFAEKISDDVTFNELKDAFSEFLKKVAIKNYPPMWSKDSDDDCSDAHGMATSMATSMVQLLRSFVEEKDDPKVTAAAGELLLHAWLTLLSVGPHSTHIAVMRILDDCTPRLKDYIPRLPPSKIVTILKTMNYTLHCPKFETDPEEFGVKLRCCLSSVYDYIKRKQLEAVQTDFLELFYSYVSQLPKLPEVFALEINLIIGCICDNFEDENPYLRLADAETFKKHISLIKDIACSDATGEDTPVTNRAYLTMRRIINGITADKNNVLEAVFDHLMSAIIQISKHPRARKYGRMLYDAFDYQLFEVMRDSGKAPSNSVFESCQKMMAEVLACGDVYSEMEDMLSKAQEGVVNKVKQDPGSKAKTILKTVKGMLLSGRQDLISKATQAIDNSKYKKGKVFVWKQLVPEAIEMINIVGNQPLERMQDDKVGACKDLIWTISAYKSFIDKLLAFLRKARVTAPIQPALVASIITCLESPSIERAEIAAEFTDDDILDLSTVSKEMVTDILRRLGKLLKNGNLAWENTYLMRTTQNVLTNVMSKHFGKGNAAVSPEHLKLLLSIVKTCGDGDSIEEQFYQEEEPDRKSVYFLIYCDLISTLVRVYEGKKYGDLAPIVPDLMKWASISAKEEHDQVMESIFKILHIIGYTMPTLLKDSLPKILHIFLSLNECNELLWGAVNTLYPLNPNPVHKRLNDLFRLLNTGKVRTTYLTIAMLYTISKTHGEVFTSDHIPRLLGLCGKDQELTTSVLMILSNMNAKLVQPHFTTLCDDGIFKPGSFIVRAGILATIGCSNESLGQKAIDYLMKYVSYRDQTIALAVLNAVRSLMPPHVPYMQKHRAKLEKAEKMTTNPEIKDLCHQMILVLDGISIEEVFGDVKQQQEDMVQLDTKVDTTIDTVHTIGGHVVEHHKQIKGVKKDIVHIEERVDEAEEDIDETKMKVEEIDNKTMTNAPKWSRDLTKLLNPKAENDWRLLASRLGYINDDIRAWAQQNDPCMALLSEWYATHKTSEASFAVLTALQEMNRMDGAAIVENAMKAAEGVVEDEDFEYASPPPIFLSYQWGMQEEVKLLQRHLNMAGYECWMDIGQMGGGDKLFAKIDNGIRAAKVIICCTTEKYAMSPNCNREVNLSVNLGKPIIPLLMEKMAWPPKGSMGPIFSEYLFIRFFQRGAEEETKDNRYWPIPKFQELLMQLNYYVVPESKLIKKAYTDWWKPMTEEIVIDKKKTKTASSQAQGSSQMNQKAQPLVFLSYQWGMQTQVKILYQRLTSLGYTVWMDIYQMGGGDSLYDKIDRGLRGCKAIVSCVTPKYAISANCRREVSLADALKKPIIPLLLEQMTWPPDGPMSMVFTQLLFINFSDDSDVQMTWKGPRFNELSVKLQEHIPAIGSPNIAGMSDKGKLGGVPTTNKSKPAGKSVAPAKKKSNVADMKSDTKASPQRIPNAATKKHQEISKDNKRGVAAPTSTSNNNAQAISQLKSKATISDTKSKRQITNQRAPLGKGTTAPKAGAIVRNAPHVPHAAAPERGNAANKATAASRPSPHVKATDSSPKSANRRNSREPAKGPTSDGKPGGPETSKACIIL